MDSVWHPVLKSDQVKSKPVPFIFLGQSLVIYRTEAGVPLTIQRSCPHRGYDLVKGNVVGDLLRCPYHGWTFGEGGSGLSPGTPQLTCRAKTRDAVDYQGAVWLRESGDGPFEESVGYKALQVPDSKWCGSLSADFDGPIEVVIDNFNEIEHTGSVHGAFGYATERMDEVQISWNRVEPGRFEITSFGPQKPIAWATRSYLGLAESDFFSGRWVTTVKPWMSMYTNRWYTDKAREHQREFGFDLRVFYLPLSENKTRLFAFVYTSNLNLHSIARHVFMLMIRREISFDQNIVAHLVDPHAPLGGRRLGRFDAVLQEIRKDSDLLYS